jgi:cell division transport system permease protein
MSTMAAQQDYYEDDAPPRAETPASRLRAAAEKLLLAKEAAIVPADSIAGRALMAVIAIMTFLAALTLGATVLVRSAAGEWQSAVAREVTIQLRPTDQRDIEADLRKAAAIASEAPGIASVRTYSREESASLLEPWLGSSLPLGDLPVPRLIVVRIAPDEVPDMAALRRQLADIPGATLDDHRSYIDRMRAMARSAVAIGLGVLALVVAAAMMSVMFATRGAMAANRQIIEVLHVVGAKDGFIAAEFQRHFLLVGLKGGAIGGIIAMLLFGLIGLTSDWLVGGPSDTAALFGNLSLGAAGYGAMVGLIVLIAAVTAGTSRLTVRRTLKEME